MYLNKYIFMNKEPHIIEFSSILIRTRQTYRMYFDMLHLVKVICIFVSLTFYKRFICVMYLHQCLVTLKTSISRFNITILLMFDKSTIPIPFHVKYVSSEFKWIIWSTCKPRPKNQSKNQAFATLRLLLASLNVPNM